MTHYDFVLFINSLDLFFIIIIIINIFKKFLDLNET